MRFVRGLFRLPESLAFDAGLSLIGIGCRLQICRRLAVAGVRLSLTRGVFPDYSQMSTCFFQMSTYFFQMSTCYCVGPLGYTLGPALRIPNIKNMGKNLAPEELRISPRICPAYCAAPSVPPAPYPPAPSVSGALRSALCFRVDPLQQECGRAATWRRP